MALRLRPDGGDRAPIRHALPHPPASRRTGHPRRNLGAASPARGSAAPPLPFVDIRSRLGRRGPRLEIERARGPAPGGHVIVLAIVAVGWTMWFAAQNRRHDDPLV